MANTKKKEKLFQLLQENTQEIYKYYACLEEIGDLKNNYNDYMTTEPIDVEKELKALNSADYDLCAALITMLLREDYFCEGSFNCRYKNGQVTSIIERMLTLL